MKYKISNYIIILIVNLFTSTVYSQTIHEVPEEEIEEEFEKEKEKAHLNWPVTLDTIRFKKGSKYGFVFNQKEILIPFEYDNLPKKNSMLMVAKKGKKSGVINYRNETIIPFEYKFIFIGKNAISVTRIIDKKEKQGIFDFEGKEILPVKFDYAYARPSFSEIEFSGVPAKYYTICKDHQKSIFYSNDVKIIHEANYSYFQSFCKDYYKVQRNSKYGILDKNGLVVLDCIYDEVHWLSDQIASVRVDKNVFLLNLRYKNIFDDSFEFYSKPDENGNMIVSNKRNAILKKSKQSILNIDRTIVYGPTEYTINRINDNIFSIQDRDKLIELKNEKGENLVLLGETPVRIKRLTQEYFTILTKDNNWAILKKDGTLLLEDRFNFVQHIGFNTKGLKDSINKKLIIAIVYNYDKENNKSSFYLLSDGRKLKI